MSNILKTLFNRKVGLVLGSGGAKGIAHIAVIEYLNSLEIPIDMICGSSIGALIGALYCVGSMDNFKRDLLAIPVSRYSEFFDPILPVSGLLSAEKIMNFLKNYIPENMNIEKLRIPFRIVSTDYYIGYPVIFDSGNILEAVRSSISIPGIFKPVRFNDTILVDGGVANPLPIDVVNEMGAGITIAVNLHPSVKRKEVKEKNKEIIKDDENRKKNRIDLFIDKAKSIASFKTNDWLKLFMNALGNIKNEEKLPNIFDIISQSIDIMGYTNTKQMLQYNPPTVLIEPALLHLNSLEFNRADEALKEGQKACDGVKSKLLQRVKMRL